MTGFIVNSMPFWTIYYLSLLIDKYKSFCSFCVELIRQFCFHPYNSFNTQLIKIFPYCLVRHWFFFACAFRYRPNTFWETSCIPWSDIDFFRMCFPVPPNDILVLICIKPICEYYALYCIDMLVIAFKIMDCSQWDHKE